MNKKILSVIIILVLLVIFKSQITLVLMQLVDLIGYTFNINIVNVIDLLNELYYL